MDKAFIFDVYDFVSFHVCKNLLNQGIEVKGIHVGEKTNEELFLEEKRLEIGRNANFEEENLFTLGNLGDNTKKETYIFSFFDFFMIYKESLMQKEAISAQIYRFLGEKKVINKTIVFLLPIQMAAGSIDTPEFSEIKRFIKQSESISDNVQVIYLPTVFGPWQPSTFIFQHSLMSGVKRSTKLKRIREVKNDAMFIDDAVETLVEIIDKGQPGKYVLMSGEKDQWDKCALFLNIKGYELPETYEVDTDVINVKIKKLTPISDAFSIQKEHYRWLNNNK